MLSATRRVLKREGLRRGPNRLGTSGIFARPIRLNVAILKCFYCPLNHIQLSIND